MNQTEKAQKFQRLHDGPGIFVIPNPWDAGSARVLEGLGFEALATTSSGYAASLGRHDGEVSREDALRGVRAIAEATELPVSADLENCFGDDPRTVGETMRLAAAAGAVGGSVEDYTSSSDSIYPFEQSVERVAAAVEAARSLPFPFVLTARAENFLRGRRDMDDTLRRLQAYERAGADVLYAPGLHSLDEVRAVCSSVSKPVNVLASPGLTVEQLAGAGVRRVSVGGAFARAAVSAFRRAAAEVRDQGTFRFLETL